MALLFLDSFDHYATADIAEKWTVIGTPTISAGTGRRSSAALRLDGPGNGFSRGFAPGSPTAVIGLAINPSTLPTSNASLLHLGHTAEGANGHVEIQLSPSGILTAYRGGTYISTGTGTVLGAASTALTAGVFNYIEVLITIANTTGRVEIRRNGSPILSLTNIDTQQGSTAGWNVLQIGRSASTADVRLIDDLYVLDGSGPAPWNDFLGDIRVDVRYPTAEGASSQWTPSTGTDNALLLDETAPNDDTDYTSTSTAGQKDSFIVQDAPVAGAAILGVQVNLAAKKTDAGACSLAPIVRHSGIDNQGTDNNPSTSYTYLIQTYGPNPGTGAQWTEADFNAAEFGYIRTA